VRGAAKLRSVSGGVRRAHTRHISHRSRGV
jgi:hypothetical protein